MTFNIDFSPTWPFLSQLTDTTFNHETPVNTSLDCGPTCIAMIVEWLTGVQLDPDDIKDIILGGESAQGTTTGPQLRSFLSTYCGVPTTRLYPQGVTGTGSLTNLIWAYTVIGKPLIALKRYSPTDSTPHWVDVIGLDGGNVFWADPETGKWQSASYAVFANLYLGVLIGVERIRDPYLG